MTFTEHNSQTSLQFMKVIVIIATGKLRHYANIIFTVGKLGNTKLNSCLEGGKFKSGWAKFWGVLT